MPNPVEMRIADHRKVDQLFEQYQQASDPQQKLQVAKNVLKELGVHSKLEEQVFYPALEQKASGQLEQVVSHSYEEHATVDKLVEELKAMASVDQQFESKFQELMQNVKHHVQEEETKMLPEARTKLGGEADRLGTQMEQKKQELMASAG